MNEVYIAGKVKRDAKNQDGVLDFAVEIDDGRKQCIIDCVCFERSEAYKELEGFVTEGEYIALVGKLSRRTSSDGQRIAGVWVDVRQTQTIVVVTNLVEEDEV